MIYKFRREEVTYFDIEADNEKDAREQAEEYAPSGYHTDQYNDIMCQKCDDHNCKCN